MRRRGLPRGSVRSRTAFVACGPTLAAMGLASATPARAEDPPASSWTEAQDEFWGHLQDVPFGPLTLDVRGQLRLRYEYDDGFTVKGYEPDGHDQLLLERVRLDLSLRAGEDLRVVLQFQDAHAFLTRFEDGDFAGSSPLEDAFDVRQFYIDLPAGEGRLVGLRLGRQQISYGDQRVFGPGSWGNTGRYAWDAAMVRLDTEWLDADLWVGRYLRYQSDVWPDRAVDDFFTFVGYAQIRNLPLRLDTFYVFKYAGGRGTAGESGAGNLLSHTVGVQAEGQFLDLLDAGVTAVVQAGTHGRDALRAFGANGKLGVAFPVPWAPRLGAQYTGGSGDADPRDGVHGTFDGVFGGRDIFFYGYTNLFFWANLHDAEVDLSFQPWHGLALHVEHHHFRLDQATDAWYTTGLKAYRRDPAGRSGTNLGDELDARVVCTLWNHLELMAGYGRFFPGTFVERTGAAAPANWYFAQAAYSW